MIIFNDNNNYTNYNNLVLRSEDKSFPNTSIHGSGLGQRPYLVIRHSIDSCFSLIRRYFAANSSEISRINICLFLQLCQLNEMSANLIRSLNFFSVVIIASFIWASSNCFRGFLTSKLPSAVFFACTLFNCRIITSLPVQMLRSSWELN